MDSDGISCQVIKQGEQWQKGKFKVELTANFYPD
ncbi:MAG: hypothetical protein F6K54_13535 [Okeania sp. SIO3B5]|nr:hypothetical protein [Okeania sp. SIO3B5]